MHLPNYTQVPNEFIDKAMRSLNPSAVLVFLAVCRKTIGFHKQTDAISTTLMAKMTGLSQRVCIKSVRELEAEGLLVVDRKQGSISLYTLNLTAYESSVVSEPTTYESCTTKERGVKDKDIIVGSSDPTSHTNHVPVDAIITDLNLRTGRKYRAVAGSASARAIRARWADGCWTLDDFKLVHEHKAATWLRDPKMTDYVRPSTLYRPSHFEEYVLAARAWRDKETSGDVRPVSEDDAKVRAYRRAMGIGA